MCVAGGCLCEMHTGTVTFTGSSEHGRCGVAEKQSRTEGDKLRNGRPSLAHRRPIHIPLSDGGSPKVHRTQGQAAQWHPFRANNERNRGISKDSTGSDD